VYFIKAEPLVSVPTILIFTPAANYDSVSREGSA